MAVLSGSRTIREMPRDAISGVRLLRGDGLLRVTFDVTSTDTTFAHVLFETADVWDVREGLPSLLAVLPTEVRRLEVALADACAARSLPFAVGR
jgi:hypothetical protein